MEIFGCSSYQHIDDYGSGGKKYIENQKAHWWSICECNFRGALSWHLQKEIVSHMYEANVQDGQTFKNNNKKTQPSFLSFSVIINRSLLWEEF